MGAEAKQHYGAVDGLRAFSAIGIVLMHIRANAAYSIGGFLYNRLVPSFTNLVFLFMMVSAFGMCCGYYERIVHNKMTLGEFYGRRYKKIWPYFALLCMLDLLLSPGMEGMYEVFANLTLCFGLLPDARINVIGVGWFLGIVFLFYLLFPFFCWLLQDKRRAWFSFGVMLLFNRVCSAYFFDGNHVLDGFSPRGNFIYCAVFFMAGGLVYLYKGKLEKWFAGYNSWVLFVLFMLAALCYYRIGSTVLIMLALFSTMLAYAVTRAQGAKQGKHSGGVLENRIIKFISGISMEIYLSHMVVFRAVEKMGLLYLFPADILNYLAVCCWVTAGTAVFSVAVGKGLRLAGRMAGRFRSE